jgi:hypothetical protein
LTADQRYKKVLAALFVAAVFSISTATSFAHLALYKKWIDGESFKASPIFHRLIPINEDYYPQRNSIPDLAAKALEALPGDKSGILLYFPEAGSWFGMPEEERIFIPSRFKELQINLNYLAPGMAHVLFINPFPDKPSWAEANLDLLAWIPLPEDQLRPFWLERFSPEEYPLRFLTETVHAMADLKYLPPLPGETITEFDFFEGRRLRITRLDPALALSPREEAEALHPDPAKNPGPDGPGKKH